MSAPLIRSYKATSGRMIVANRGEYPHSGGHFITPQGVVGVYMQTGLTILAIVLDGREIRATWEREFSEMGLTRIVRRFAKEATP